MLILIEYNKALRVEFYSLVLEVGQHKDDLHNRIHIAAVAKIIHPRVAWAIDRLQLAACFLDYVPLPNLLIEVNLQFNHCLLSLHMNSVS